LYRITREDDGRWLVVAYMEHDRNVIGPQALFDDDALPDWIRKDVVMLSMVDRMGEIKSIGHRVGEAFWLTSEQSRALLKKNMPLNQYFRDSLTVKEKDK
jgi:fructose 1,6-bisphosphatase